MAVLRDWDRRTVDARLTAVTGLDYFRRLPEVMGAHLENRGLLELFHHRCRSVQPDPSSPRVHPAALHRQSRHPRNPSTRSHRRRRGHSAHPSRNRPGSAPSNCSPGRGSACNGCSTPPPTSPAASRPTSTEPSRPGAPTNSQSPAARGVEHDLRRPSVERDVRRHMRTLLGARSATSFRCTRHSHRSDDVRVTRLVHITRATPRVFGAIAWKQSEFMT